jgi:hypothetical protein
VCKELLSLVGKLTKDVEETIDVGMGYPGEHKDARTLVSTGHVYLYSETALTNNELVVLSESAKQLGQVVVVRSTPMVLQRATNERPRAFISHDFRDKDVVVRPLAQALAKLNVPLWYDEYSLRVGDGLRESVERGLKECGKCIIVLSPNFLANSTWTKAEFNSIFTGELVETRRLILPVWYQVTKKDGYDYSPSLADSFGAWWDGDADRIARKLYVPLMDVQGGDWIATASAR